MHHSNGKMMRAAINSLTKSKLELLYNTESEKRNSTKDSCLLEREQQDDYD
jgi:hypothetical protein